LIRRSYYSCCTQGLELPISGKWRHGSITGFMRNVEAGMRWPRSGTPDSQADCFVKVVPAVAVSEPRTVAPPKTDKNAHPLS
jgi:hypothetical protein